MHELDARRRKLFAGAAFSSAVIFNGEKSGGQSASFRYFSGCGVDYSYLVLKKNGGVLFANGMNLRQANEQSHYPVRLLGKEGMKLLKKECGMGKVGADLGELSAARCAALRRKGRLKLVDAGSGMAQVRGEKSAGEVAALAASAKIARGILDSLEPWKCKTEGELAAKLKIAALERGAEVSFEPIVATGKNSALPHHSPTGKKLGGMVLVDFGVKYRDYCSDFTRCYFRRGAENEKEAYEKCRKVFGEMLKGLGKCKTGKDVALLSEKLVKKNGLPKMIHSIGHGIGLEVHEYPHLWGESKDSLQGAVLAIEPAAYFKPFGVRYEEMVVNTKKGWKRI